MFALSSFSNFLNTATSSAIPMVPGQRSGCGQFVLETYLGSWSVRMGDVRNDSVQMDC